MSEDRSSFLPAYDVPSSTDNDSSSRSNSAESSRSSSPSPTLQAPVDDISIKVDPDRHVDYLSHDWTENDIWVSWRHVTKQKAFLQSGARLENASWRTWAKSRNNLKTISPETLNWLKDCDVTWLYGPLHRGTKFVPPVRSGSDDALQVARTEVESVSVDESAEWPQLKPRLESHSSSYVVPSLRSNKPILKKRSNSEMMLARHHIDRAQYTDTTEPTDDTPTEHFSVPARRPSVSRTHSANSALRSARKQHFRKESGGEVTKRHIHFNESVEQCISIIKPDPEDDGYSSASSDDAPTMRISAPKPPINIAKLPSTTLKLPSIIAGEQSELPVTIFAEDDDSDDDDDSDKFVETCPTPNSMAETRASRSNSTESAILPNYDGVQDGSPPGIFGRAAEVVSSARDLVSVIWSASGWRRTDNNS